jgi:signal transduction histidine kinase
MSPETSAELEPQPAPVDDRAARLAALAHEVRAPLASVEGWAELLLDGALGELTDEQVRAVEVVRRNAERIGLLVDELRWIDVAPPPRSALGGPPLDLAFVVSTAVDLVRPSAWLGAVALEQVAPHRPLLVLGDPSGLEGAVVNVLENAVKYTARGGSVRVRTVEEPGVVVVEVVDTGMGVPAADLARLTEPRFRAANATSSAVAGDGLGLALVREVLAAHGGELSVSSVEGEGTTVRLRLPAAGNAVPPAAV